jgi:hypothetical protein
MESLVFGTYVLGSMVNGLIYPRGKSIKEISNIVQTKITNVFTENVQTLIRSTERLQNFNRNNFSATADGKCTLNRKKFTQNINSVAGISKVLDQRTYTNFITETMNKVVIQLENEIRESGNTIDLIIKKIAGLLGYQDETRLKTEISKEFTNIMNRLYSSRLETDTNITVDNQNNVVVKCFDKSTINIDGTLQNIVQNSIIATRIQQVNEFISTNKFVNDINDKIGNKVIETNYFYYILIAVIILIIIIVLIFLLK